MSQRTIFHTIAKGRFRPAGDLGDSRNRISPLRWSLRAGGVLEATVLHATAPTEVGEASLVATGISWSVGMVSGKMGSDETSAVVGGGGAAASAGMRFEQQLGALFGSMILSQRPMDESLDLGNAVPVSVRFETEAPVDDILVETSEGGYVAVQAKRSLALSPKLDSPFGSTILQFVRHWMACRDGGRRPWQRRLDPRIDRLVLAAAGRSGDAARRHRGRRPRPRSDCLGRR